MTSRNSSHRLSQNHVLAVYVVVMLIGSVMLWVSIPDVVGDPYTAPPLKESVFFIVGGTIVSIGALRAP